MGNTCSQVKIPLMYVRLSLICIREEFIPSAGVDCVTAPSYPRDILVTSNKKFFYISCKAWSETTLDLVLLTFSFSV